MIIGKRYRFLPQLIVDIILQLEIDRLRTLAVSKGPSAFARKGFTLTTGTGDGALEHTRGVQYS